jgi:uncharacterized protein (TIGR00730 family)
MTTYQVTVFCGAQPRGDKAQGYLDMAYAFGRRLAEEGFECKNGANMGMMAKVCEGAHEAGGIVHAVSLNQDKWPMEHAAFTRHNNYVLLTDRQQQLLEEADAFVALPGGAGTHFEILEIMTKKGIEEIPRDKPLICVGNEEYAPLLGLVQGILDHGFASRERLECFTIVPDIEAAIGILKAHRLTLVS